ncbi:MAG: hypothetical protein JWM93_201 [Frankiales bacterium]|nr:hypothetical protein [Frankiales bacterium]
MLLWMRRALVAAVTMAGLCTAVTPAAQADFGVSKFDAGTCTKNTEPAPQCTRESTPDYWYSQAAGHPPWGITDFAFNTTGPLQTPDGNVKDVHVDLPVGLSVNPEATPKCTTAQLEAASCPADSAVGTNYITTVSGVTKAPIAVTVYNMVQPAGMPARFGMTVPVVGGQIYLDGGVAWASDYHESFTISNITADIPIYETRLVFDGRAGDGTFITMPSGCTGPQKTYLQVDSHQNPGNYLSYETETPIGATGCPDVPFAPTVAVSSDSRVAGAPAGVTIDVGLPQNPNGKDKPNTATLKDAHVTLPDGMTLNPSAATGLQACTDEQLGKGTTRPVACPAASAIGTVDFETPVLPAGSLKGTVYLGKPLSGDPLSGQEYRTFLVADSPRYGVSVRLVGNVVADPTTGRLTASFTDNPQVPVSLVRVSLRGGDRAPLVNPPSCGTGTISAQMTSWSGKAASASSTMKVDQGCERAGAFAPTIGAAVSTTRAGASPTFGLSVTRADGEQQLKRIDVSLPPGLLAKPAGIPLCDDAHAAAGTCGEGSRIGSVDVTAGAGPSPFALSGGRVYLTGPYGGGPYGLSIVVPAVAGPFDLGLVVVRASVQLDRNDAHVRVLSDPLPTILDGVPLLMRSVKVTIDRRDTMRNPTSCGPLTIGSTLTSLGSLTASPTTPFAATECDKLAFSPTTRIALTGVKETTDGKHPGVDSTVTQPAGQANIKQVQVTLPLSLALDPDNARALCEFADGLKGTCPATSVIGTATARTPLLDHPLSGKVYFVKGVRQSKTGALIRTLPTLLVQLRGDIDLDLRATTSVDAKSRLVTTFAPIPDAAVSSFSLKLDGGKHGILVVTAHKDVCNGAQKAALVAAGYNGKQQKSTVTLTPPCSAAPKLLRVRALGGGRVSVAVKAMASGRVVLRGAGGRLTSAARKLRKGQTARLTLRASKSAGKSLARGRKVSERVSARFTAKGKATTTVRSKAVRLRR